MSVHFRSGKKEQWTGDAESLGNPCCATLNWTGVIWCVTKPSSSSLKEVLFCSTFAIFVVLQTA